MTRIVLHNAGFRELRTSEPAREWVHDEAEKIAEAAGKDAMAVDTEAPRNRARSAVIAPKRKQENLLRALGSRITG